jgi:hypothetical protein
MTTTAPKLTRIAPGYYETTCGEYSIERHEDGFWSTFHEALTERRWLQTYWTLRDAKEGVLWNLTRQGRGWRAF